MTQDLEQALNYAMRLTQYRVEREEIEQEVHVALWKGDLDLDTIDRALLFTIVKRTAIDMVQRAHMKYERPVAYQPSAMPSMGAIIHSTEPDQAPDVSAGLEQDEIEEALTGHLEFVLGHLPEDLAKVAALHAAGMDANQVAGAMRLKPQTVRSKLMKARQALGQLAGDVEVYRRYMHPEAKTSKGNPQPSSDLLEALKGYVV